MHTEDYGKASTYGLKRERERLMQYLGRSTDMDWTDSLYAKLRKIDDILVRRQADDAQTEV